LVSENVEDSAACGFADQQPWSLTLTFRATLPSRVHYLKEKDAAECGFGFAKPQAAQEPEQERSNHRE
jgi:hypothetical protein